MFPFNQFAVRRLIRVMLAVIIILLVSACRRQVAEVEPTAVPTFTATPRSTPLPAIATSIPAGQEENPLKMYISPVENMSIARSAASALEAALLKNDLFVQIELVEQDAQLLTALCASSSESAAVAWVSGAAYLAVEAENCGHALLQIQKGKDGDATTATASSIIARRGINSYDALDGRTFCRINYSDSATWLIPSLMLRANGINTTSDLKAVNDYSSVEDLVKAVSDGKCDAAGVPAGAITTSEEDSQASQNRFTILSTSSEIPYSILVLPNDIPLGTQTGLQEALLKLAKDRSVSVQMRRLLGQDALVLVEEDGFAALNEFAATIGYDFAQLGN